MRAGGRGGDGDSRAGHARPGRSPRSVLWWLVLVCLVTPVEIALTPASVTAQCAITGGGTTADHDRARLVCLRAQTAFRALFGQRAPPGNIVLSDSTDLFNVMFEQGLSGWRITWPTSERILDRQTMRGRRNREAELTHQWETVLPHEIGHLMLTRFVASVVDPTQSQYGTHLPDWFDEAVAVALEPLNGRASEYAQLRRQPAYIPPLDDLLGWTHPVLDGETLQGSIEIVTYLPCPRANLCPGRERRNDTMRVRTQSFPDGTTVADTTFYDGLPPEEHPIDAHFYIYSAALLDYLVDRGGTEAIAALVDRWRRDPEAADVLTGLPGLPPAPEEVAADWESWFAETILGE